MARGADPQTAEDIAQEVALRAIDRNVPFYDVDDFCGWAYRVARNLYVDHARARGRLVGLVDIADRSDGTDLHGEVEQRLTLGHTLRALQTLDAVDQAAIVAGVNETVEPTRKAAVRMAVRRHRARARLLRLVEGIAAFWALMKVGKRSVQIAPVAVAACGVLALPAVIKHIEGHGGPGPAGAPAAPVAILDRSGERSTGAAAVPVPTAVPRPGGRGSDAGRDDGESSAASGRDVLVVDTPNGEVGVRETPPPEKPCTFGSGDRCYVPTVPGLLPQSEQVRDLLP